MWIQPPRNKRDERKEEKRGPAKQMECLKKNKKRGLACISLYVVFALSFNRKLIRS